MSGNPVKALSLNIVREKMDWEGEYFKEADIIIKLFPYFIIKFEK